MIHSAPASCAPLTERQAEILGFIMCIKDEYGRSPTYREIGAHFGIRSPNGVTYHIRALEQKGYIEIDAGLARGMRLTDRAAKDSPEPTRRDLEVFAVVAWLSLSRRRVPTFADIAQETGLEATSVTEHLERLRDFGYVTWSGETPLACVLNPPMLVGQRSRTSARMT